ncbi:GNAT family N-acyltransferase [Agarilytica rhodophyticola]|uniref:GNAT family N-acyltransferase n=1 Tax=Agarilytica rhodophyticola TaxID=1737490 RepID=UPI000B341209|nr:lysophospholipid acyltransferase family protein [Agarilytica rhodophyticola]
MINIEQAVLNKFPGFAAQPTLIRKPAISFLKRLIHEDEINAFLEDNKDAWGFEFIDRIFEYFNFSYVVSARDRANIPASGRVVIFANHPIGSLDGLAILKLVGEVRSDVRIVANDMLSHFKALEDLIIPVDNMVGSGARRSYKRVLECLEDEQAIIVFPAGEVSRAHPTGVKDTRWRPGFLHFARKAQAPLLPIRIHAKNSLLFYGASMVYKPLGTALLAREMFNKHSHVIKFSVGEGIPSQTLKSETVHDRTLVSRLKKHLYKIGKHRRPIFETERTIAHPEDRRQLLEELKESECLGETRDGNRIYLVDYKIDSKVIREIGRLRELAFRKVGEGTGKKRDLDQFDQHYRHLVLWDRENLVIAGAYRLGEGKKIMQSMGVDGFYTRTLYTFRPEFTPYLEQSVELGRSFVNPDYWGKASLDYLWQGLGSYLAKYPEIRYLIGPVSMSAEYPKELMDTLAYYYRRYHPTAETLADAYHPYKLDQQIIDKLDKEFGDLESQEAFDFMQKHFVKKGHRVPILFKQYTAIFENGGFNNIVFSVDPDFGDCLDGLCLADLHKLKASKRKRYIEDQKLNRV